MMSLTNEAPLHRMPLQNTVLSCPRWTCTEQSYRTASTKQKNWV